MSSTASNTSGWKERLRLAPHPEGGFYRVTYTAGLQIPEAALVPAGFGGSRAACTAIYFYLEEGNFSAFHRLRADEMWHFYDGDPLVVYVIDEEGARTDIELGPGKFQAVVRAGCWFASRLQSGSRFALVGCTVAPGFDFEDFELAQGAELASKYPQHRDLIYGLTRT
jgi:uncharacterized protein